MAAPTPSEKRFKRIYRRLLRTIRDYGLIEPDDKIMVCMSGGKDSYTLLDLLWRVRARSPFPFEIVAVHLDQVQPGYDGAPLAKWLAEFGAPYEIVQRDTYSVVVELTKPGGTYCSACSRLRRGILYDVAERHGCTKIALGHHRDDALETALMNMFFAGKLQAMPAKYRTDCDRFDVIRPMIEIAEADIIEHAAEAAYPILPCNLCGSQPGLQREQMGHLLANLEQTIPNVREVMLAALKNVRASHLLDQGVAAAVAAAGAQGDTGADPIDALGGGCDSQPASDGPTAQAVTLVTIGG
ncbi:MAG: tRNA 2-thiocytidine(32) synthetase TtcA [Myxococcales bacterium]|nr:tRNA 2-thiocytidine(32) synthetase TtcA [Myxococcales bacterium]MCB9523861.1 tRNA 2-thiocytidine(32) synthetase TtcA [Myxococcales bacterium]